MPSHIICALSGSLTRRQSFSSPMLAMSISERFKPVIWRVFSIVNLDQIKGPYLRVKRNDKGHQRSLILQHSRFQRNSMFIISEPFYCIYFRFEFNSLFNNEILWVWLGRPRYCAPDLEARCNFFL